MVVVTKDPYPETEPMLSTANSEDPAEETECRKNSYTEEAYKNIRSSMKADPLQITCPKLGCDLLLTAVNVQNILLAKQCIENLDSKLSKENVLSILAHLSKCKMPLSNTNNLEPSAPPMIENENQLDQDWVQDLTDNLRHNCLLEIDKNADFILKQKGILELSYSDLLSIVTRDTLLVSKEVLVYTTIMKWGIEECRRRTLQPHYIKAVLRDLCYAPRYGLMSKKDFTSRTLDGEKGPTRSGILEEKEWRKILFFIKEKHKNRPVEDLPFKGSQLRIIGSEKPKMLSSRSAVRAMEGLNTKDTQCTNTTTCERFFFNILTCWSAIFD